MSFPTTQPFTQGGIKPGLRMSSAPIVAITSGASPDCAMSSTKIAAGS